MRKRETVPTIGAALDRHSPRFYQLQYKISRLSSALNLIACTGGMYRSLNKNKPIILPHKLKFICNFLGA
jgi:hypothetical protein